MSVWVSSNSEGISFSSAVYLLAKLSDMNCQRAQNERQAIMPDIIVLKQIKRLFSYCERIHFLSLGAWSTPSCPYRY